MVTALESEALTNSRLIARSLRAVLVIVLIVVFGHISFAADSTPTKNVLIMFSFSDRGLYSASNLIKSTVQSHVQGPVNFYVEYLESQRFEDPSYEKSISEALARAYSAVRLDVVLVFAYPALSFAIKHRDEIFPGVPIVFEGVDPRRIQGQKLWPGVTGITYAVDVRGTLDLALRLDPGTKNVAVVTGTSEFERYWLRAFQDEFRRHYEGKLKLIELVGLSTGQLLQEASALPRQTVVFFNLAPRESTQPLGASDTLPVISRRFPTYCMHVNFCLGEGGVGGSYPDVNEQRVKAGELVARILAGEKPENIPVIQDSGFHANVDWRQLRRWNIPESALPPGSVVLYREPTAWERYRKFILGGVALVLLQALLITALLWQRNRAEKILRQNEALLRTVADHSHICLAMLDADRRHIYANSPYAEWLGLNTTEVVGKPMAKVLPQQIRGQVSAWLDRAFSSEGVSDERTLPDIGKGGDRVYAITYEPLQTRGEGTRVIVAMVDITERKRAEKALRESEERFRSMYTNAAVGIQQLDNEGRLLMVNATFCRMLGFSESELLGQDVMDLTHPDDHTRDTVVRGPTLRGERNGHEIEKRYIHRDGSSVWVHITSSVVKDALGHPLYRIAIVQDVTERKQAERDQELNMKVLHTLNRGDDLHTILGEVLGLLKESTGFDAVGLRLRNGDDYPYYQQTGFPDTFLREEHLLCFKSSDGSTDRDAYGRPVLGCACGLVLSGGTSPGMSCFTEGGSFWTNRSSELLVLAPEADPRKNPRNRCIHAGYESVALIPVRSGAQIIGLLQLNDRRPGRFTLERIRFFESLAGNITLAVQRRQVEDELRSNEARLRLALDAANSGTWESDLRTHKSKWSSETWRLYGLDPYSCESSFESWLSAIHPEDREMAKQHVKEAIDSSAELNVEYRVVDSNGGVRWLVSQGRPLRDGNGDVVSYVGIVTDISDRKHAEHAMVRSEKLASVGRMAATMAHEINNPLATAMNAMFLASVDPTTSEDVRKRLELAETELKRAAHIATQTLGLYREVGTPTAVNLSEIVDDVLDLLRPKLENKLVSVQRRYRSATSIQGIKGELLQVVSNLVANSLDAVNINGNLYVRTNDCELCHGLQCQMVRLTIADNGIGISQENLKRIFEPFFTTKQAYGTGLGLWVAKELIGKNGGDIRVHSQNGRGSVFSIWLPADRRRQQRVA